MRRDLHRLPVGWRPSAGLNDDGRRFLRRATKLTKGPTPRVEASIAPARLRADIDELSACWPAPGFDAGRTGHNPFEDRISPDTVDDLHQIWTAATMAVTSPGRPEEPVVSNQAVHVSAGRALYALSKSTGARLWRKVTDAPSPVGVMGQAVADGDRVLVGHGFPNLGGNWVTEAVDAATGAPLAEVGAGLVDGLRGSTLLTRRQGFGTGTPVAISLTVTDLDQPGSGWAGRSASSLPWGASPSRRHSPLARTSPSSLATGLCSSLVVH